MWTITNWRILETVTDTDMKLLEHGTETHKVYQKMFDMCSISYSTNVNTIFELFPCTPQARLSDIGYVL
jgi:hypothetical protein